MVQSEAMRRAKLKYYQKMKDDEDFKKYNCEKMRKYYETHREHHIETVVKYQQKKKEEAKQLVVV